MPRKSYYDFHKDLFPLTLPEEKFLDANKWCVGENGTSNLVSLNPKPDSVVTDLDTTADGKPSLFAKPKDVTPTPKTPNTPLDRGFKAKISIPKHSAYRHVATDVKTIIDDIKIGTPIVANEANGYETNDLFFGFFISGNGGRLGISLVSLQGRMPPKIPCIINGTGS